MYAIRVVGPSGYEQFWVRKSCLSDTPETTFATWGEADSASDNVPSEVLHGRYVDVVNLEGE